MVNLLVQDRFTSESISTSFKPKKNELLSISHLLFEPPGSHELFVSQELVELVVDQGHVPGKILWLLPSAMNGKQMHEINTEELKRNLPSGFLKTRLPRWKMLTMQAPEGNSSANEIDNQVATPSGKYNRKSDVTILA